MAGDLKFALLLSVIDKASAPLKAVKLAFAATAEASAKLQSLSQSMHDSRENIQDFADRGRAALASLIAPAAQVQDALLELGPVAAMMGSDASATLQQVQAAATSYSQQHSANAAEYVRVAADMMRAGQNQAQAIASTSVALQLAAATTSEAKGAASSLNVLYQAAGDKTADWSSELGRLADVLTRTRQVYGDSFNVAELSDPLKDSAAAARDARVPVEQLVGALGAFGAAGIKGGEGGMAVANAITGMQAAAKPLGVELVRTADGGLDLLASLQAVTAKYGDLKAASPATLAAMQQAFGSTWRDVSTLLGQTDKLSKQWTLIGNSAGASAAAQAAAEGTMTGQLARLDNQLNAVKVTLGTGVMNATSALAPELLKVVEPMSRFVAVHPQLAAIAATVAVLTVGASSVVAPIISAASAMVGFAASALTAAGGIGAATAASWAWTAALLANPITWIVLAVVAAAALIIVYWKPISAFFVRLWAGIKEAFSGAWNSLVGLWGKVTGWFSGLFGGIRDAFKESFVKGLWQVFLTISPLGWLIRVWGAILPWLSGLWSKAVAAVWKGLQGAFGAVASVFSGIWTSIKDAFGQGILQGLGRLFELFNPLAYLWKWWNAITQFLFGLSLTEVGARIISTLVNGITSGAQAIWSFLGSLGSTLLQTITSIGSTLWSGISNDLSRVWDLISSFSLAEAGMKIVRTIADGIRAAAAVPAEAMADVVQRVRNYLPFSPAKEGPLKDLHRVRLVETVASAVRPAPLVAAMRGATAAALTAVTSTTMPELVPIPAYATSRDTAPAAGAGPTVYNTTLQLGDGSRSAVEELEAWIRDPANARAVAKAVSSHQARLARTELG